MAKRKTGLLEILFELASLLPWWLSLALAPLAYLLIHPYADVPIPVSTSLGQSSRIVITQTLHLGALFGQYIIPFILLIGSVVSLLSRAKRQRLYQDVQRQPGKQGIEGITWREFEMLVGEWFRRHGYAVRETDTGPDGGVDLVLTRDGETYLVQCKQWKAYKVGVNIVRELLGVMASQGAAGGYIVTSGDFTKEARRFAASSGIKLIDGNQLASLIRAVKTTVNAPVSSDTPASTPSRPVCPVCGADMRERKATRGAHAGQSFWGCTRYPQCRGTRTK
jgi:restriction system protein